MLKIISLGNEWRGDDSIGPYLLKKLEELCFPVPIQLINAGTDAFQLLDHLMGNEPLLIIDCAQMGKSAGTVCKFHLTEANIHSVDNAISLHGFSFGEMWRMAGRLGDVAPCTILGIEPEQIEFGKPLSEAVQAHIPQAMQLLQEEINQYAN